MSKLLRFLLAALLLGSLPLGAQDSLVEEVASPGVGPIRIVLFDGCHHAIDMQAVARTRTTLPVSIEDRYITVPGSSPCQYSLTKVKPGLTALAKAEEAAQQQARRRHEPIPLTIFYIGGTSFYGSPDAWKQAVDRLARAAILIAPAGNLLEYDAADLWPSGAIKIGSSQGGRIEGSRGKVVSSYVDFGGAVVVVIDGVQWSVGATSTAAMLFASRLGNVLSRGAGAGLTPAQIQAKIRAALREEIVKDEDLEERLEEVLR